MIIIGLSFAVRMEPILAVAENGNPHKVVALTNVDLLISSVLHYWWSACSV